MKKSEVRSPESEVGRLKSEEEINSAFNIPIAIGTHSEIQNKSEIEHPTSEIQNKSEIEHPNSEIKNKSEIENPDSEITTMEVHHRPQLEHKPKPWKEYILEGLMIFLAVMMGFFAESYREHINDRAKENGYMVSLNRDLHNDIRDLDKNIKLKGQRIELADSALSMFGTPDYKNRTGSLYYWGRLLGFRTFFKPNDGTVQQLYNAGGLRLIHKKAVLDSLQHYINQTKDMVQLQDLEESQTVDYRRSMGRVFDALVMDQMFNSKTDLVIKRLNYNPPLITTDKMDINDLNMKTVVLKGNRLSQLTEIRHMLSSARALINLIHKEYNLGDE